MQHHDPGFDTDPVLWIIDCMSYISGGVCLSENLKQSEYVAIRDGDARQLIDKCDCQLYRGSGYGLKKFGYEPNIGMQPVTISQGNNYLLVGPGDNFKLKREKDDLVLRLQEKLRLRAMVHREAVKNSSAAFVPRPPHHTGGVIWENEYNGFMKLGFGSGHRKTLLRPPSPTSPHRRELADPNNPYQSHWYM
jgi:hypothetical protein